MKPLRPKAFLAFWTASVHFLILLFFLPIADCFLDTILPYLFFTKSLLVKPPMVFSLLPRKTSAFANLPLAILLTFIAFFFIAFIAAMAFIDFIAFIAAMAFIAFIAAPPCRPSTDASSS